jgi:hypothetical protein
MPLPSRKKGESRKDTAQRVAICNTRAMNLSDEETSALSKVVKPKKKSEETEAQKDKKTYSGCCAPCATVKLSDDELGSVELYSLAAEKKKPPRALNKPFRTPGGPKKFSVYVKNDKGNIVKVNFGDPNMEIKRDDPGRRKNFRARHNCDSPGPKWKARYWSCRMWEKGAPVSKVASTKIRRTSYVNEHTHSIPEGLMAGDEGETSYDHGHVHKYYVDKNGLITIEESGDHIHYVYP